MVPSNKSGYCPMVLNAMNSFEMPKFTLVVVVCGEAPVQMEH